MRSMSEGRWFYVFLDYLMTMKKDAESVQQYRQSIRGAECPKSNEGNCTCFFYFLISISITMKMIWQESFQLTSLCGAVGEATELHRTKI